MHSVSPVIDDLAAVLAQGVLRLHRRAIDAAPGGEQGIVSSDGFSPESGDSCLEVVPSTRPCGSDTGVDAVGPLGLVPEAAHAATREGVAQWP